MKTIKEPTAKQICIYLDKHVKRRKSLYIEYGRTKEKEDVNKLIDEWKKKVREHSTAWHILKKIQARING